MVSKKYIRYLTLFPILILALGVIIYMYYNQNDQKSAMEKPFVEHRIGFRVISNEKVVKKFVPVRDAVVRLDEKEVVEHITGLREKVLAPLCMDSSNTECYYSYYIRYNQPIDYKVLTSGRVDYVKAFLDSLLNDISSLGITTISKERWEFFLNTYMVICCSEIYPEVALADNHIKFSDDFYDSYFSEQKSWFLSSHESFHDGLEALPPFQVLNEISDDSELAEDYDDEYLYDDNEVDYIITKRKASELLEILNRQTPPSFGSPLFYEYKLFGGFLEHVIAGRSMVLISN